MSKHEGKTDLKQIFLNLQNEMLSRFSTQRQLLRHPTARGDASEVNWIELLNCYLPERYKVNKTFVLDHQGTHSEQIDLVIYDRQYSPLLFKQKEAIFVPAESVYAVFEIRQRINKRVIEYAGAKAASVRRLKRTSLPIPHAGGVYPAKRPFEILAGILSGTSDWKPPLDQSLTRALRNLAKPERLDLGCVLGCEAFEAKYEGPLSIEKSQKGDALIFFFVRLLDRLQKLGTAPAMDISKYAQVLR